MKKPFLCRLGLHDTYQDCALFSSAIRCNRCGAYLHPYTAQRLRKERELWASVPEDLDTDTKVGWVFKRLYGDGGMRT